MIKCMFSWHESGIYDLPAMITYIVKLKQSLLRAYIGFSMGTTCFYVMSSERPQIARLLQSMYSLAPVVFMKHVQSPLRYLAPFATNYKVNQSVALTYLYLIFFRFIFQMMLYLFGEGEFLPQSMVLKFLAKYLCFMDFFEEKICANSMFVIVGFDKAQFNYVSTQRTLVHVDKINIHMLHLFLIIHVNFQPFADVTTCDPEPYTSWYIIQDHDSLCSRNRVRIL